MSPWHTHILLRLLLLESLPQPSVLTFSANSLRSHAQPIRDPDLQMTYKLDSGQKPAGMTVLCSGLLLREPRYYFVILRAIAQGKRKMSEIINDTGFEKSHLARYLDILRSLRFVDMEIPVTKKYPDKSRHDDCDCNILRWKDFFVSYLNTPV